MPCTLSFQVQKLERRLALSGVIAISVSTMLGSGIFVLPGLAAAKTGPSIFLAYILSALCVLPAALSKAELATAMPTSGGTYIYLDRTFGPLAGTIGGLGLWISLLLKSAFALVGFGAYLVVLADFPIKPTAIALLLAAIGLNIVGIKKVGTAQKFIIGASLLGLGILGIKGLFVFDTTHFEPFLPMGSTGLAAATAFVFVSYAGVTNVAAIAEEVKNPERNLPLGILLSLGGVALLYALVTSLLVGVIPLEQLKTDLHPVYTLAHILGGQAFGIPAAVIGVLTMTSMATAGLLSASRFPFAMSRENLMPPFLTKLQPRFLTPVRCIGVSGGLMAACILLFDIESIAKLASAFIILIFAAECLAVLVLRETGVQWYKPTYRSPLYPWMQIFGIISGVALLVIMGPTAAFAGAAATLPGAALYFAYGRKRTKRSGVISKRGRRADLIVHQELKEVHFASDAAVTVALWGSERSPEILVELGAALTQAGRLEVAYLTEVPEQTAIDSLPRDNPRLNSVRRRVGAVVDEKGIADFTFDAIACHDVVGTVAEISNQTECKWLVMEWAGRPLDAFTFRNPLGWLKDHVDCNLAVFSDAGVRYIRRILVHVEHGAHDTLVASAADALANVHGASLTFVRFRKAKHDDKGAQKDQNAQADQAEASYLDQIRRLCATPSDVLVVEGKNAAAAIGEATGNYDLLVTEEKAQGNVFSQFIGTASDKLTQTAACSVLRIQSPPGRTHEAFNPAPSGSPAPAFQLSEHVDERFVQSGITANKMDAIFEQISQQFAESLEISSADVEKAFWKREREQTTGVGRGVALPHAVVHGLKATHLGIFTTQNPVDFKAPDGTGVDVFFATLGPPDDRHTHLLLLSAIARLSLQTDLLDQIRAAKTAQDVVTSVADIETGTNALEQPDAD